MSIKSVFRSYIINMRKLWIFALLPLLFVFGCGKDTAIIENNIEPELSTPNYFSENIECQKLIDQFKKERPEQDGGIYRNNYSIFYSPQTKSCMWAFSQSYNNNLFCYRIFDIFNSSIEYSYCYNVSQDRTYSNINWEIIDVIDIYKWWNINQLWASQIEHLKWN